MLKTYLGYDFNLYPFSQMCLYGDPTDIQEINTVHDLVGGREGEG